MAIGTAALNKEMVFRKTGAHRGRLISVTPENSASRHLCYGRIILNSGEPEVRFGTGGRETGLIVLAGSALVEANGEKLSLSQYDGVYIPRDFEVRVRAEAGVDIAEFSADVEGHYPLQVVSYADVCADPTLHFTTGAPNQRRQIFIVLGKNVEAGRLLAGFTLSEPGNWTSWPPHEHAAILEEMYVYFNMPAPAFGIQLVYNQADHPQVVTVVREGDAVLMPDGYHPNVSIPGHSICFLWAMAAHRETEDRRYGVVNVQPEFAAGGSGLEASRK